MRKGLLGAAAGLLALLPAGPALAQASPFPPPVWEPYVRGDYARALTALQPLTGACGNAGECANLLALQSFLQAETFDFDAALASADAAKQKAVESGNIDLALYASAVRTQALFHKMRFVDAQSELEGSAELFQVAAQGSAARGVLFWLAAAADLSALTGDVDQFGRLLRELATQISDGSCNPQLLDVCANLWNLEPSLASIYVGTDQTLAIALRNAAFVEAVSGKDSRFYANALAQIGVAQSNAERFDESERTFLAAFAIYEKLGLQQDPDLASAMQDYADLLTGRAERQAEAVGIMLAANQLMTAAYGEVHPEVLINYAEIAGTLAVLGAYPDSVSIASDVYNAMVYIAGEVWLGPAMAQMVLSMAKQGTGDLAEASAAAEKSQQIFARLLGEDHPIVAVLLLQRGTYAYQAGQVVEAEKLLRPATARMMTQGFLGEQSSIGATVLSGVYLDLPRRLREARHWNRVALDMAFSLAEASGQGSEASNEKLREYTPLFRRQVAIDWRLAQGER